jgi:Family of unknown function (DUF5684)
LLLASVSTVYDLIALVFGVVAIIGAWMTYVKADRPGWAAIIPFYNIYVLCKIVGRPGWWLILFLIPFVDIVVAIIVCHDLSKRFGHGGGFTLGLVFLPFIFWCILGFGSDRYLGAAASQ